MEKVLMSPCKGMNCGCTDGVSHSLECQAEHAAAIAGGQFVKPAKPEHPSAQPQAQGATLRQCANPDSAGSEPQAQGEPPVGWVHGWKLERANESKREAMRECRELREAIAQRDAALGALSIAARNYLIERTLGARALLQAAITQAKAARGGKEGVV